MPNLYNIYNNFFLHYYCFNITDGMKKGFGLIFVLYLVFFFVETSFCEYNVEYQENNGQRLPADHNLGTQKKYTFSELASTNLPKSEEGYLPKSEEGETFTLQQKKLLMCAAFFTLCAILLFQTMNAENHDLQNRVANSEKQIEKLKRLMEELFKRQASSSSASTGEWKKPTNWQYGFGF